MRLIDRIKEKLLAQYQKKKRKKNSFSMSSSSHLDKIKKLRELTGVGFGDCNTAINECDGDIEKSIKYLRIKGISKASKKMERVANDGLICIHEENNKLSIIEINCETDFAAKNLSF